MEVGSSSDGVGNYSSGGFHKLVTRGKGWKIKKRYMGLLLKKGDRSRKKGKNLKGLLLGPRNKK
jgi:hypothetical protein